MASRISLRALASSDLHTILTSSVGVLGSEAAGGLVSLAMTEPQTQLDNMFSKALALSHRCPLPMSPSA